MTYDIITCSIVYKTSKTKVIKLFLIKNISALKCKFVIKLDKKERILFKKIKTYLTIVLNETISLFYIIRFSNIVTLF